MQRNTFIALENWYSKHTLVKDVLLFFAEYSIFVYLLIGLWLSWIPSGRLVLVGSILALIVGRFVFAESIYRLFPMPRPYQHYKLKPPFSRLLSWKHKTFDSFPSGHTSGLVAASVFIMYFFPVIGVCGLILAILTGFARVITGFHFILDIFGGIVFGFLAACVVLSGYIYFFT
jgi:membrane-associated phospholipid phosphatase